MVVLVLKTCFFYGCPGFKPFPAQSLPRSWRDSLRVLADKIFDISCQELAMDLADP